ncbi:MAG TPA: SHOCT domain-containing protein [Ktedonobacteraceae bacterium]|jgi:hypothetical protein|nr:SHOCT domain-containing protein [Ktedonobacteraceae bacterium]
MQRYRYVYRGGPWLRRPPLLPFGRIGRGGLLNDLLVGGLGYLIGRQQGQAQYRPPYQPQQPQGGAQGEQLTRLKLLGELRESGVLTEEEFQAQKQKILHSS